MYVYDMVKIALFISFNFKSLYTQSKNKDGVRLHFTDMY